MSHAHVLCDAFEVAEGLAHGCTDVFTTHGGFLEGLKVRISRVPEMERVVVSCSFRPAEDPPEASVYWQWMLKEVLTSNSSPSKSCKNNEDGEVPLEYVDVEGEHCDAILQDEQAGGTTR